MRSHYPLMSSRLLERDSLTPTIKDAIPVIMTESGERLLSTSNWTAIGASKRASSALMITPVNVRRARASFADLELRFGVPIRRLKATLTVQTQHFQHLRTNEPEIKS